MKQSLKVIWNSIKVAGISAALLSFYWLDRISDGAHILEESSATIATVSLLVGIILVGAVFFSVFRKHAHYLKLLEDYSTVVFVIGLASLTFLMTISVSFKESKHYLDLNLFEQITSVVTVVLGPIAGILVMPGLIAFFLLSFVDLRIGSLMGVESAVMEVLPYSAIAFIVIPLVSIVVWTMIVFSRFWSTSK